ncbi:MAG: hypothetical protein IGR79_05865 [Fischerella thermalis M48_A2018_028]|nr:hypothetical protein [Fischerella thermalis M58_A2018_009]MBF2062081.1 hypothetical protein [Fischerella thermalis M66_A2018_004]MBF2069150.1 hypothetical protein [Fischerella thermalis M48_A2018_028]PLZ89512.1 hypothetical protein CI593_11560 [Fischerella thermalis CCMEE 5194]
MTKSTSFAMDDRHKLNNSAFLEIENLVKSYPKNDGGEFVVLDNVNLTVGEHPRDRAYMRNSKKYYELRNYALNFLERNFTTDE